MLNIRYIFIIMLFCIVSGNAFQGYWLYQAYQKNVGEFRHDVQSCLLEAVQQSEMERVYPQIDSSFKVINLQNRSNHKTIKVIDSQEIINKNETNSSKKIIMIKIDTSHKESVEMIKSELHYDADVHFEKPIQQDSFLKKIISIAFRNNDTTRLDIEPIKRKYKNLLAQKNIYEAFQLDTICLQSAAFFEENDSLSGKIITRPVSLNFRSSRQLKATFQTPNLLIFKRMSWLLFASFLLLGLTAWCFIYMLQTIIRQKKLAEIKNDFINNMTHELRTPVATVSAAIEAMQKYDVLDNRDKTQQYLAMSATQLTRLSDLIDEVLTTAVEDNKNFAIEKQPFHLNEVFLDLLAQHQLRSKKTITVQYSGFEKEIWIEADAVHFANALNNLLDNAIKYTDENVLLKISYHFDNQHIISISDNGKGISAQYLSQVFDKFFRVPTGDLHNVKGFGLGLAYVKKVITEHGGTVQVISELEKGTTFEIRLQ
jgi:signal transduction histidine kinase